MFVVLYHWRLRAGHEEAFSTAWSKLTALIHQRYGSLGSRLHRAQDETWVAYAQWPDRQTWQRYQQQEPKPDEAECLAVMKDSSVRMQSQLEMEVTDDQLVAAPSIVTGQEP